MRKLFTRRMAGIGFVAGVAVLTLASAAFGCTTLIGSITVTGNGPNNVSATAYGRNGGMYMDDPAAAGCQDLVPSGIPFPTTSVRVNRSNPAVDIAVAPEGSSGTNVGNCPGQLPAGTYIVGVLPQAMIAGGGGTNRHNCHNAGNPIKLTSGFTVPASGVASMSGLANSKWSGLGSGEVWSVCAYSTRSAAAGLNFAAEL